ncbi:glutathione ABC transporter substrate-binding protein [Paenibacillus jiagnxiensis]|uniref:glutathione ABC transporter substrate-binding protein n=1 Tax=Paenibacillus jiagnxiensis TaxID=3228926 RepID=UPI0033A5B5FD
MKPMLRALFIIILVLMAAGCSANGGTAEPGASGNAGEEGEAPAQGAKNNEITIAVNENFITMDPHATGDRNSGAVQSGILEGLVEENNGQITPLLAESFETNEEATEYTFKLRKGVKFHDGTDFNAAAVKTNFERITDEANGLRLYSRGFNDIKSIEALDDYTIKITLNHPNSSFMAKLVPAKIVSPKALESGNISKHPVGTGPYQFVEWIQGDSLTVQRNPSYWNPDSKAAVEKITFKPVPENGSRVAMLKTGEADFIYPLPVQNMEELKATEGVEVTASDSTILRYVTLNTMKKPFDDIRVRQTLNYAVNKDAYISVVMSGLATPLDSNLTRTIDFYQPQSGTYTYDPEKAKQLLAEAGYPDGFSATIWGNTNSDTLKGMQFIQQQLSQIGVKLKIESIEEATLSDKIYGGVTPEEAEVEMWYVSWGSQATDTDNAISPIHGTANFPPTGGNASYYSNTDVDNWLQAANETTDREKKQELYGNVQSTIYREAPWIFLASDQNVSGKRSSLDGVFITPQGRINYNNASLR